MSYMRSHSGRVAILALIGSVAVVAAQAPVIPTKRDAALQMSSASTMRVIVTTRAGEVAAVADTLRERGRSDIMRFSLIDAIATEVTPEDLDALDANPAVLAVSIDAVVAASAASATNEALAACAPLQATLGLPARGLSGQGVGVAIIDT